jgi:hypothetical protein
MQRKSNAEKVSGLNVASPSMLGRCLHVQTSLEFSEVAVLFKCQV